jgi:hypothetical protein
MKHDLNLTCGCHASDLVQFEIHSRAIYRFECRKCGAWWEFNLRCGLVDSSEEKARREARKAAANMDYATGVYGGKV